MAQVNHQLSMPSGYVTQVLDLALMGSSPAATPGYHQLIGLLFFPFPNNPQVAQSLVGLCEYLRIHRHLRQHRFAQVRRQGNRFYVLPFGDCEMSQRQHWVDTGYYYCCQQEDQANNAPLPRVWKFIQTRNP